MAAPRVAIVHDWLTGMRGGERCLEYFLSLYPEADLFTLLHKPGAVSPLIESRLRGVSVLQRLPAVWRYYRFALPLYPLAVRSLDLRGYDLVISLSHAAAKNVQLRPGTKHICYCFTPMRYIWDQMEAYLGRWRHLTWPLVWALRWWDVRGGESVTTFVAISHFVAARIRCFYGRRARVVFPPVATSWIKPRSGDEVGRAFLVAGALVPYKRVDLAVAAFRGLEVARLWVVGDGPEMAELRRLAPDNVEFLGRVSDEELAHRYRSCRALIFPGVEDFGMIPVECMAAGRPVIGFGIGGLKETVVGVDCAELDKSPAELDKSVGRTAVDGSAAEGRAHLGVATGVFAKASQLRGMHYDAHLVQALRGAIVAFMECEQSFSRDACLAQAEKFSPVEFVKAWHGIETEVLGQPIEALESRLARVGDFRS